MWGFDQKQNKERKREARAMKNRLLNDWKWVAGKSGVAVLFDREVSFLAVLRTTLLSFFSVIFKTPHSNAASEVLNEALWWEKSFGIFKSKQIVNKK